MMVEEAGGLVPPRPNLGPEPWREPAATPVLPLALSTAAVLALSLLAAWYRRRRKAARARELASSASGLSGAEVGPRGRLVGLSEAVRDALAARFGPSVRARTTEELADDARLAEALGAEAFRDLIRFLDRIDRIKFAPGSPADHDAEMGRELSEWEPIMRDLATRVRSRPRRDA